MTYVLNTDEAGPVEVTVGERGKGHPFLLLHGGGGPQTFTGFADLLASTRDARVIVPTHPGFGGTARPEALASIGGRAAVCGARRRAPGHAHGDRVGHPLCRAGH